MRCSCRAERAVGVAESLKALAPVEQRAAIAWEAVLLGWRAGLGPEVARIASHAQLRLKEVACKAITLTNTQNTCYRSSLFLVLHVCRWHGLPSIMGGHRPGVGGAGAL